MSVVKAARREIQQARVVPVSITQEECSLNGIKGVLPEGCVAATLQQCTLWYLNSKEFRDELDYMESHKLRVWTATKGLKTGGALKLDKIDYDGEMAVTQTPGCCYRILADGTFESVSEETYKGLPGHTRAFHLKGEGRVSILRLTDGRGFSELLVIGEAYGGRCRVAYVAEHDAAADAGPLRNAVRK